MHLIVTWPKRSVFGVYLKTPFRNPLPSERLFQHRDVMVLKSAMSDRSLSYVQTNHWIDELDPRLIVQKVFDRPEEDKDCRTISNKKSPKPNAKRKSPWRIS